MENDIVVLKAKNTTLTLKKLVPDVDLEEAMSKAVTEYCGTPDGNIIYQKNGCKINYSNFKKHVPNDICEKYGFLKVEETKIKDKRNLVKPCLTLTLTEGACVYIKGNIRYARILSPIDGWELRDDNARRSLRGHSPIGHPYYTITVKDAEILPNRTDGYLTIEEQYVMQKLYYPPRLYEQDGAHYTINTLNKTKPKVYIMRDEKIIDRTPFEEPYKDTPVILVLKVIPRRIVGKVIELDSVVICETARQNDDIDITKITSAIA